MIKRRFYKQDHADKNAASDDDSSSSSDSDSIEEEEEEEEEVEVEEEEVVLAAKEEEEKQLSQSPGSGYQSEDSSGNEVGYDSSGLLTNEDVESIRHDKKKRKDIQSTGKYRLETEEQTLSKSGANSFNTKDSTQSGLEDCIMKCNSVFKCRLCPRIVCLTEDTLRLHLKSKRHTRSKKLLNEGRLKLMLNSDGEIDEDQETHAERHARTIALARDANPKKKNKGRQRQKQRLRRKKLGDGSLGGREKELMKNPAKRRRKNKD